MVQPNLNFTHTCQCSRVPARLLHVKLKNFGMHTYSSYTYNFSMYMTVSEYMHYMSDACHKLTLGLPQYMCGVKVRTVDTYRQ